MSSNLVLIWWVCGAIFVPLAIKSGRPWIASILGGILLGPIALALEIIVRTRQKSADERERSRRPTLDSSGPTLDSGPTPDSGPGLDAGPSVS